ncbi:MAG: helix-turn-helix transcriptional regulator [Candidatus Bathyarchaeia archaeon]|jgi:uncharacterized membrane protein
MSHRHLTICIVTCALLLLAIPVQIVECQNYYEYHVQIRSDGSALWIIKQFSNANATTETWESLQTKIFDLIDEAYSATNREMDIDENSVQINTTISSDSKTTEYSFLWLNFSVIKNGEIFFGDVFKVHGFFNYLFGDAAIKINYPSEYAVKSVYPPPTERQDTLQSWTWARTQDLTSSTAVVLTQNGSNQNIANGGLRFGLLISVVLVAVVSVSLVGFYMFKRRRNNAKPIQLPVDEPSPVESEEDKITRLLKTSGGTLRQSEITETLKFSKAKTSQLLTALESRGILTRYKKGRDKIVNLKKGDR